MSFSNSSKSAGTMALAGRMLSVDCPRLRRQDGFAGVLENVVGGLGKVAGGRLQAAGGVEDRAAGMEVAEGLNMVFHCGGSAGGVGQHLGDCSGAADKLKAVVAGEDLGDGDDVWHTAGCADVADDAEDLRVGRGEEKVGVQTGDLVDHVGLAHQGAQDGNFDLRRVRNNLLFH
jgi:hypothetical protein